MDINTSFPRLPQGSPLVITHRPYAVVKSQKDGESDLVQLATSEQQEGAWWFTPTDSTWYHTSISAGQSGNRSHARALLPEGFVVPQLKAVDYHTHIAHRDMKSIAVAECDSYFKQQRSAPSKKFVETVSAWLLACNLAIPSPADLHNVVFHGKTNPRLDLEFRIASPAGVTKYGVLDSSVFSPMMDLLYGDFNSKLIDPLSRFIGMFKGKGRFLDKNGSEMIGFLLASLKMFEEYFDKKISLSFNPARRDQYQ